MEYDKPHLTLDEQLEQLTERGLRVAEPTRAIRLLETVGYYRLSAYAYPFRTLLEPGTPRETTVQYRASSFDDGADFSWVEELWRFDRDLRLLLLDAVETIEISLRSKVGFHLGFRDKFGYLSTTHLDEDRCNRPDSEEPDRTIFGVWLERYLDHQNSAVSEDFIRHYVEKYDAKLPIWVATEIMEFGQLVRLYGFMLDGDKSRVSSEIAGVSGAVYGRWLKVANYGRNLCAHHARLWNRTLTYKLGKAPDNAPDLAHLNEPGQGRDRVYGLCAMFAYLTDRIRPEDGWTQRLVELVNGFPEDPPVSPETQMGFPTGWRDLLLWSPK